MLREFVAVDTGEPRDGHEHGAARVVAAGVDGVSGGRASVVVAAGERTPGRCRRGVDGGELVGEGTLVFGTGAADAVVAETEAPARGPQCSEVLFVALHQHARHQVAALSLSLAPLLLEDANDLGSVALDEGRGGGREAREVLRQTGVQRAAGGLVPGGCVDVDGSAELGNSKHGRGVVAAEQPEQTEIRRALDAGLDASQP
mmetsp:Transcript_4808/g.15044  ORF Transcript_4808/g.15044 Transcript_4808/m.15044 type:complete len:202 (-) Transcript_4808:652-1257(-)